MDFTNGDVNDLKAAFQEMKEQIRVLKSEYAKYSDLTEWKRDLEVRNLNSSF